MDISMASVIITIFVLATLCQVQAMRHNINQGPSMLPMPSGPPMPPGRQPVFGPQMARIPLPPQFAGRPPVGLGGAGAMPYNMGYMGSNFGRGGQRRNFRKTPLYRAAKTLGCSYGIDSESILRYMLPQGCTPQDDFCPYKYSGYKKCTRVGPFGMCCPFYVTEAAITQSVRSRDMMRMIEMLS